MRLSLFLLSLLVYSCGASVAVDYEKQTNFGNYTTYNYYPKIESGLNALDDKRIIKATDSILESQGIKKSDSPQFYVNFYASEHYSNSRNTIGVGVGSGGFGISGGIPIGGPNLKQQVTIDFIDVGKDDLFWQAIVESNYKPKATPHQREQHYKTVVDKALKKYPPKNKIDN